MISTSQPMQDVAALASIGLYAACEDEPVFKQLARDGVTRGEACGLEKLNKVDNMNYFGAEGSQAMLLGIQERLGSHFTAFSTPLRPFQRHFGLFNAITSACLTPLRFPHWYVGATGGGGGLRIVDVGAGYGGTSRVMIAALERVGCSGSTATALELQPVINKTAAALTGKTLPLPCVFTAFG